MISKKDFKKITDYLWEIPKSFRADMRVPARAYVSEKMLEESFKDKSLEQLINVATLPGIQKYALAMPDMHQGYASCIGGVAAIRTSDGIISPGMQGYDINCLSPDTKVLSALGFHLPIKKLERKKEKVKFVDFETGNLENAEVVGFLKRYTNPSIYKVVTQSGEEIEATEDHPFYSPNGMVELKRLKEGDELALYSFKGVPYEDPSKETIISEHDIKETILGIGRRPGEIGFDQNLRVLKKRNLLPLTYDHPKLPYLLKIIGFVFGDGSANFIGKRKDGITYFIGKPGDLEEIRSDIKKIGYTPSPVHFRKRKIEGRVKEEYSFVVNAASLVILLKTLGVPLGEKTFQAYRVPEWIFRCPIWQKRLFLASLFGAELRTPHRRLNRKFGFNCPVFPMNKGEELVENGKVFLEDLSQLLKEFGVNTCSINCRQPYRNKKGQISYKLELIFSSRIESLINLWSKIGYEYNKERQSRAAVTSAYLKYKQKVLKERERAVGKARFLKRKGVPFKEIYQRLCSVFISERFIRDVVYKGEKKTSVRIPPNFPTWKEYFTEATKGLKKRGLVWDKIEKIEKEPYQDFVYDITINNENHNFIANNFVVSNCGVRLLKSEYTEKETKPYLDKVATEIQNQVPSGLGRGRQIKLSIEQIDRILEGGVSYLVEKGYGEKEDTENCEAGGRLKWADAKAVSERAKNRGRDQVGTLGSGNHFMEIQKVAEIFDEKVAEIFGLFKDQVVIMIHTGSRGLGHQVCTDYLREFIPLMERKYKIKVPDREFACVPFNSSEGQRALAASGAAANYAWANRQMITHFVRKAWKNVLGQKASPPELLYDVAHNIIKKEIYNIDGKEIEVAVHRKGATRAFPPDHPEVPKEHREQGQVVLIPGTMGTASYVLVGTKEGEEAFYSTCHGGGRAMSRHAAIRKFPGREVVENLENRGIIVKCRSFRGIAEEAPGAYKDVESVVDVVHNAGLSKKVAKLVPLAVIKGE